MYLASVGAASPIATQTFPLPTDTGTTASVFPRLPLLESVTHRFASGSRPLAGIGIVCVQHLLETTGSLIEAVMRLGVLPEHVFMIGKLYSNSPDVQAKLRSQGVRVMHSGAPKTWGDYTGHLHEEAVRLWEQFITVADRQSLRKVIVLDDGGHGVTSVPASFATRAQLVGIEQTMSGTFREHLSRRTMPVIDVASSAAKKYIEAPLISQAIMRKLTNSTEAVTSDRSYGVVGLGNVGTAVAQALRANGHSILAFDPRHQDGEPGVNSCATLRDLFERSNYIFGCTGRDVLTSEPWWTTLEGRKILVSCSSNDTEFRTILAAKSGAPNEADALCDVTIPLPRGTLKVLRAGYPYNFDGTAESVPRHQIQMTRGLLLGSILQAAEYRTGKTRSMMLSPQLQQFVVDTWLECQPECKALYPDCVQQLFLDVAAITQHSGGSPNP